MESCLWVCDLVLASILAAIVIVIFLQTWRAAISPIVAMPVSLIGTFVVLGALGYSLNSLSLFGLVLAVGIVSDDAIVVVESVDRHIREGMAPREAAIRTMKEVFGALVATNLVLLAVFVPTAFLPGIPGMFYREFAVTIAVSSTISLILSLTLSPALAALLLKPRSDHSQTQRGWLRPVQMAARKFNDAFDWLSDQYGKLTAQLVRVSVIMLAVYAGLLAVTGWRLAATPTGFIPEQDQGYLIGAVQLPPGASLERTDAVIQRVVAIAQKTPGVVETAAIAGLDGASFSIAPNSGTIFIKLADFDERRAPHLSAAGLSQALARSIRAVEEANIVIISPPAVPGLGTGGGFKMMVQDRAGLGYGALERATTGMRRRRASTPSSPTW